MKQQYILKLGEFRDIFSHARAIGNLISSSGLEDAWIEAEWFDSKLVGQQVLYCNHMIRAIEAHEGMTAIKILKIREIMCYNPDYFVGVAENIAQTVNKAITSMEVSKDNEFRDALFTLKSLLSTMNCRYSFSKLEKRFFTFTEAS